MAKRRRAAEAEPVDETADELRQLREEMRVIRDVLDEIRDELTSAIRNGRVIVLPVLIHDQPPAVDDQAGESPPAEPSETPPQGRLF